MYNVSQEIRLNTKCLGSHSSVSGCNSPVTADGVCIFGKYQRTPDADTYDCTEASNVFIAPELTDASKVQLLHFPSRVMRINSEANFIIKRNGVRGNFEVRLESPSGTQRTVPLDILDPSRLAVKMELTEAGLYKVHIKCNSVPLPKSPLIVVTISGVEPEH